MTDFPTEMVFKDSLYETLLYVLANNDVYMEGVSGLTVFTEDESMFTYPRGCIARFVSFVSHPGASATHVELLRNKQNQYSFWINISKPRTGDASSRVFLEHDSDLPTYDLIFLVLSILDKWNIGHNTLKYFKKHTGITEFRSDHWSHLEVLLHHCLYLATDRPRTVVNVMGYRLDYLSGFHLKVSHHHQKGAYNESNFFYNFRKAVHPFMNGTWHKRSCKTVPCILCKTYAIRNPLMHYLCYDLQTIVVKYVLSITQ